MWSLRAGSLGWGSPAGYTVMTTISLAFPPPPLHPPSGGSQSSGGDGSINTEAPTPRKELGGPGREAMWPHPGDEVLLQLLHQEVRRLLLVGLVRLQVAPGLLGAGGEDISVSQADGAVLDSLPYSRSNC